MPWSPMANEAQRAARCAQAERRAEAAHARVHLFSTADGGVSIALERAAHLKAVARRARHAMEHGVASPRPLCARVITKTRTVSPLVPPSSVCARAFALGPSLEHALPPSVLGADVGMCAVKTAEDAQLDAYVEAVRTDLHAGLLLQQARFGAARKAAMEATTSAA